MIKSGMEVWLWLRSPEGGPGTPHVTHPQHDAPVTFAQPLRVGEHVMLVEADGCARQWLVTGLVHWPFGDPATDDTRQTTPHVVAILE
jgi:hypothetical protein